MQHALNKPPEPSSVVSLLPSETVWKIVGSDLFEWFHPQLHEKANILLFCDEASSCPFAWVDHRYGEKEHHNITQDKLWEMFLEMWMPIGGKPQVLRVDPEGAWKGKDLQEHLLEIGIELDVHAGEASWQGGQTERKIRTIEDTMNRIVSDRPDLSTKHVLALAIAADQELERHRGYSPAQWVWGRQPDWDSHHFDSEHDKPETISGPDVYFR